MAAADKSGGILVPSSVVYQGDQIGRIFAYWATVHFSKMFINYRRSQHSWTIILSKNYEVILTKKVDWATFWAIFFTNSSGRPVVNSQIFHAAEQKRQLSQERREGSSI
jgi:hypothetical protein